MTPRQLSEQLKAFGIKPMDLKYPGNVVHKGYRLDQFEDAFNRYLAPQSGGGTAEEPNTQGTPTDISYSATNDETCGSLGSGKVAVADEVATE